MTLPTVWFVLAAGGIAIYVILDGYDLGAGIVHLFVGRTPKERALAIRSIGPLWDGNEVWLLAAGGTLVLAFPRLYATAFSGFHLPLTLVLWLLVGRALAIELRHQIHHRSWEAFWDAIFFLASALLVVCFGAALGNVVRGVPIGDDGQFFLPLWGDADGRLGILDGFTVSIGVAALAAVAMHGSTWLAMKLDGDPQRRARRLARVLAVVAAATTILVTLLSWRVQPHIRERLAAEPWIYGCAALAVLGIAGVLVFSWRGADGKAFVSSCAYLGGMLTSAVSGLYPYVLPATTGPDRGLTVSNASASSHSLFTGLAWWLPGIAIALGYTVWIHRRFAGKVTVDREEG